jgi:hypothetical protein
MGRFTRAVVLAAFAACAVVSLAAAQDGADKEGDGKAREEKLRAALKQCGTTCHTATSGTLAESQLILGIVQKGKGDLSVKFPQAVKAFAAKNPKGDFSVEFAPPKGFGLKQLTVLLGKADAVVAANRNGLPIDWQWYDWCAFGTTKDGQIVGLAADAAKYVAGQGNKP